MITHPSATRVFYDGAPRRTVFNGERKVNSKRPNGRVLTNSRSGIPDFAHRKKMWTVRLGSMIGELRPFLTPDEKREAGY